MNDLQVRLRASHPAPWPGEWPGGNAAQPVVPRRNLGSGSATSIPRQRVPGGSAGGWERAGPARAGCGSV